MYKKIKILTEGMPNLVDGDLVSTNDGKEGIIQISKHPYYSIWMEDTGINKTYHYNELQKIEPIESEFGKYDIEDDYSEEDNLNEILKESPKEEQIIFNAFLEINEGEYITDVLSSIRGIQGVTIVNSHDIPNSSLKTNVDIKIDPYPFNSKPPKEIKQWVINQIKLIPQLKNFKIINKPNPNPIIKKARIPVKDIDSLKEQIKKIIKEETGYSKYGDKKGKTQGLTTQAMNDILLKMAKGEKPSKDWGNEKSKNQN